MDIKKMIKLIEESTKNFTPTLIDQITVEYGKNPYLILIACLLSLRSKDSITIHVCRKLFLLARSPKEVQKISRPDLERLIYQSGFYKNKAKAIHEVSAVILDDFNGKVPKTYDELISIPGVGPKTANLVLGMAFGISAICVDTHVHRISNRLGIVKTKTPEQSQVDLKKIFDKEDWIKWNKLMVLLGQNICLPRYTKCCDCSLFIYCKSSSRHISVRGSSGKTCRI